MADMEVMEGWGGLMTIWKRGGLAQSVPAIDGPEDTGHLRLRGRTDSQVSLRAMEVMGEAMRLQCSDRPVSSGHPHAGEAQRDHMETVQVAAEAVRVLQVSGLEASRWKVSLPLKNMKLLGHLRGYITLHRSS